MFNLLLSQTFVVKFYLDLINEYKNLINEYKKKQKEDKDGFTDKDNLNDILKLLNKRFRHFYPQFKDDELDLDELQHLIKTINTRLADTLSLFHILLRNKIIFPFYMYQITNCDEVS